MQLYTALILDVKNSKSYGIDERNRIQLFIIECIEALNMVFRPKIERKVIFSGGDELQGLFSSTVSAVLYVRLLSLLVYPVQIRGGLGIGEWSVRVEKGNSAQQDGTAYHYARKAIEDVYGMQTQRFRIYGKQEDSFANPMLNASYGLCKQLSPLQNLTLLLMEYMYPFTEQNLIREDGYKKLKPLIIEKYKTGTGGKGNFVSGTGNTRLDTLKILEDPAEKIWIFKPHQELEEMLLIKGMAAAISKALGTTRQNIDKMIKNGNMIGIRSLDLAAVRYINIKYEE